jgi:hypothetical protein
MAIKLVSRAGWGARAYRQPSGGTLYTGKRRGVKLHYLGTPYSDRTHDRCDDYVRQIQAQHMDGNGWSDIGYSFVVCTHGTVFEGRGLRRRNSANGNTTLNNQDYAVLLMVGSSGLTRPTTAQLHGARDAIDYCRSEGPAGTWIGGHRDGYATTCPGDPIYAWAKAGAPRPTSTPAPSEEDDMPLTDDDVKRIAEATAYATQAYRNKAANEASLKETGKPIPDAYGYDVQTHSMTRALVAKLDALTAVNKQLVDVVAALAADLGDLDPASIVTELRQAIESVEVRLDVPDTTPTA